MPSFHRSPLMLLSLIYGGPLILRRRGGLVINTSDSGFRGRGFDPHSGRRVVSLRKTYLPPKVLVIPRKRWLHPNMTEKLFTGMLSIKPNQTKPKTFNTIMKQRRGLDRCNVFHNTTISMGRQRALQSEANDEHQ